MNEVEVENVAMNLPSLCIPRVFKNITEARIRKTIGELNIGDIERIDVITKTSEKGDAFNRVFIHFKKWYTEGNAKIARERLLQGKEIKIIYDEPWFWKVSAYRNPRGNNKPIPAPKKKYVKPSFQFEDEKEPETETEKETETKTNEILVPRLTLEIPDLIEDFSRTPNCSPPPLSRSAPKPEKIIDEFYGEIVNPKKKQTRKAIKVEKP